ncbi:hypothetical protein EBB07_28485 [Paenibacillaceae bacterium]|nr:hypothetical protein EBB07_28485 [Paenibacillaceae bacterium]
MEFSSCKDMSLYRKGRLESDVMQTWLTKYKHQIMQHVIYRTTNPDTVSDEVWNAIHKGTPETAEIVADTIIGWLNTHVGRCFIQDAFGVGIPTHDQKGTD